MWKNQYIDLIQSMPEYIFPCGREESAERVREQLARLQGGFSAVACELGSGSGQHLIGRAASEPQTLFVGFEIRFKRSFKTAEKAARHKLRNIALVHCDARRLAEFFPPSSLSAIYVNFPDPWDKARWQKHRLLQPTFIDTIISLLKPGGAFRYKTDHAAYFQETMNYLSTLTSAELTYSTTDLYHSEALDSNIPSEFEELFVSKKLPVHMLEAKKLG